MDNTQGQEQSQQPQQPQQSQQPSSEKLVNVEITNENVAFNLIISFLTLAQKRGAFGFDESAKIWECIKKFQK
jgi:hypothetical protein